MELRKDYILDKFVLLASERKTRPKEFKKQEIFAERGICKFCPGNEDFTPDEIGRIERLGRWKIRWFPNKFPAVEEKGDPNIQTDNDYFTFSAAFGKHEVIVETPFHSKQLWDLPHDHLIEILEVYKNRIEELSNADNIQYVTLFKNHGREAGTSLIHSHTQVVAMNFLPTAIKEKVEAIKKYAHCPYCDIINIEKNSFRRCFENNSMAAFTPYASRFNYEIWIFPKNHKKVLNEFSKDEMTDLAEILGKILGKLKELNASYNYFLHYSPPTENLHFHIEVTPRLAEWAGFEFSTDAIINSVTPEDAAKFYRGEKE